MSEAPKSVADWREAGRFIDVGGRSIFVVDQGPASDEAVLILHGFPASSFDWRHVAPQVASRRRVVTFDFLGYGLSSKPLDAAYSLFEQADLAEAVASRTGIRRCVLVSHDMGDSVAAELLGRAAEGRLEFSIDRSIVTNGSIFIDLARLSPGQLALLALPDSPLAESLPLDGFRPGLSATFSAEHQPSEEELDAMLWLIANEHGDRLMPRLIRYIEERRTHQARWTAGLTGYAGPMTLLWGRQDPIAVEAMAYHLAELRPATEVILWPDVGHWPSIEVPDRVAGAILARL
jgi:pimeloyl-ACP methyl ester carboxylesterase